LSKETSKIEIPIEQSEISIPKKIRIAQIAVVGICALAFIVSLYAYRLQHNGLSPQKNTSGLTSKDSNSKGGTSTGQLSYFQDIPLQAQAVYVWDITDQKVLYSKNEHTQLPLASLTKILTANTALDLLSSTSTVFIRKDFLSEDGDTGLYLNETWNFSKLLNFTLTVSSNDGAAAIGAAAGAVLTKNTETDSTSLLNDRKAFVNEMNQKSQEIGLKDSRFSNETGLDLSLTESGAYGSAADVAKLFEYTLLQHPQIMEITKYPKITVFSENNLKHVGVNTDVAIDKIPGIIASKTGYSDLAGGNLAVIYDAGVNHPVVAVVLGSTYAGRFTDMLELIKASNQYLSLQN
jgi:D-alanyl-D-alanine carboxypeptidase